MTTKLLTQRQVISFLKQEMKKRKLTLTEFARFLGVSKQFLRSVLVTKHKPSRKIGVTKVAMFELDQKWMNEVFKKIDASQQKETA
jgi:hypothetical protein